MLNQLDLDNLEAAHKRAINKGAWGVGKGSSTVYAGIIEQSPGVTRYKGDVCVCQDSDEDEGGPRSRANARFIALAYNAVPGLIAEVKRLREQLAAAKAEGAAEELELLLVKRLAYMQYENGYRVAAVPQAVLVDRLEELRKAAR